MRQWPAWATEQVHVREPDPGWAAQGAREAADVQERAAAWLLGPVEHVGSTAVPGLAAKPVVDLQAVVAELDRAGAVAEALTPRGWHLVPPELDDRPWRRFLVRVQDGRRVAHLHLHRAGDPRSAEQRAFRDALRRDPDLRGAYAELKRSLAQRHRDDREAYTQAKTVFVRAALEGPVSGAGG